MAAMLPMAISFAFGVWLCQLQPLLPQVEVLSWAAAGSALLLLGAVALQRAGGARAASVGRVGAVVAAFLLGFTWAAWRAELRLADELPAENEGRDIVVTGVVASLPQALERGVRFDFEVEQAQARVPRHLSVAWYRGWRDAELHAAEEVHAGERWQLTLRLKRPHGHANPHGFDWEGWLLERGIRAAGYVRSTALAVPNQRVAALVWRPDLLVERVREMVRSRFEAALPEHDYAGVLVALAVGDQRAVPAQQWQVFSRTGVTHLMSISGLHVTMVAGLIHGLVGWAWRRSRLALRLPAQKAAAVGGLAAALLYCLLAGFAVPAQRTLYMISVVALALWLDRVSAARHVLALAMVVVLVLDPWAVLAAGFWLSFGAVALLLLVGSGRVGRDGVVRQWLRSQWAVTVGLVPALLALFQQFSLVSPVANAVAIPLVSLVVTPLALLAVVLPVPWLLDLAHGLMWALMALLDWLAGLPLAVWQQPVPPAWVVALGITGATVLLLPRGVPGKWMAVAMLLPLVAVAPPRPAEGEARVTVLDVGQGLAVHVQTRAHDLLFDAGPQYSRESDSGIRIVLPYLRAMGVTRLDALVLTHEDTDHVGGAASVLKGVPVAEVMSSLPSTHALIETVPAATRCLAGSGWDWDGVSFEVLHPGPRAYASGKVRRNDLSCVLRITAGGRALLLTSDIEADGEAALVARTDGALRSAFLVVPHHGSRSSSTAAFVEAVGAQTAIFPVGYRSRFRHPHPLVVERYARAGARLLRTDMQGALTVALRQDSADVTAWRQEHPRYWHGR